jgi:hypothetical protein
VEERAKSRKSPKYSLAADLLIAAEMIYKVPSEHSDRRGLVAEMSRIMWILNEPIQRAQNLVVYKKIRAGT